MNSDSDKAALGLSYTDERPLDWKPQSRLPVATEIELLAEANLRVLTRLTQLEERVAPPDAPDGIELELVRVHAKLDLLLDFVEAVAPRMMSMPPRRPLRLAAGGVSWQAAAPLPNIGEHGVVSLYLHPAMLSPLRWPARIVAIDGEFVTAHFEALTEAAQQALERHVFLHHRRSIAERRQTQQRSV